MAKSLKKYLSQLRSVKPELLAAQKKETLERGKVLVNLLASHTPPANGRIGKESGNAAQVIRHGVKNLQGRIEWNFLGSRKKPTEAQLKKKRKGAANYRRGKVTASGQEVAVVKRKGWSPLPFIVPTAGSDVQPDSGEKYLRRTRFIKRKSVAWRIAQAKQEELWPITIASLRALVKDKKKHAGRMISGWLPAALKVGMVNVRHLSYAKGTGHAMIFSSEGLMQLRMTNNVEYHGGEDVIDNSRLLPTVEQKARNNFRHRDKHYKEKLAKIIRKAGK